MTLLQKQLYTLCDAQYAAFQAKLIPTLSPDTFIGVRVPVLRNFAKQFSNNPEHIVFLRELPHTFFDENMLHALLLSQMKDYVENVTAVEAFLPFVDNWAVCDILAPKVFKRHKDLLITPVAQWIASQECYTCRFGIEMLMSHYLDEDFRPDYLSMPAAVDSDEYYVKMMVAWFFATALAKQWDSSLPYLYERRLPLWTHNKTIQKACESYRITPEQKALLRTLKR